VNEIAAAVAAYGVPSRAVLPSKLLDGAEFTGLLAACEQHRLIGFLGEAVRDDALALDDDQHERLEEQLDAWAAHALRAERMLLRALDLLARANVRSRVLKGVALAHTAYARPELRVFGDVDLLVPSGDVLRAVEVLTAGLDSERAQPELRPGFDERFGKEVMLRGGEHLELDLHRVFVEGAFGLTIELDDLFAPPYRFPLAGYELEALPMPQRLLHACYAAALGDWPPRLGSQRDVVQLVLRERPHLADVLLMARAWRCEVVVARAVTAAWRDLAIIEEPPIVAWAKLYRPSRTDRMLLASHEGPARAVTRHLAAVVVLSGVADRLAYVRAISFPQPEYLRARGISTTDHARRAWRRIRG
jgi:Uncharacterised nucleotidyltransferase